MCPSVSATETAQRPPPQEEMEISIESPQGIASYSLERCCLPGLFNLGNRKIQPLLIDSNSEVVGIVTPEHDLRVRVLSKILFQTIPYRTASGKSSVGFSE